LSAMLSVLWAVHSAQENFMAIETTSIAAGLLSLALLFFAVKYLDIYAAAWISVLRIFLQIAFLMKKMGPWQRPVFNSASFKTSWGKVKPLIAGNVYYKTDALVDKYLTSGGVTGDLTLLNLAQQLYSMVANILSKTFVSTIIPSLSVKAINDKQGMHHAFRKRLWLLFIISAVFFLLVVLVGKPLLALVFGLKNFDAKAVGRLWFLLVLLFGFWFAGLLGVLTSGTFYAKGDTRTPTRIGVIMFTLYLPIKFYAFNRFGIEGLALSISIYMLFNLFLQIFLLEKTKYV
jgi:putative peptidoglycan lipid II flippase